MSCCDDLLPAGPPAVGRRAVLRGAAPAALAAPFVASGAHAAGKTLKLGFCSQFLCAPPYLSAQSGAFFKAEGLDVEIVYLRGSAGVIQALAGGAIDYGASAFEDVLTASGRGIPLTRFASTARLPLFALAVAPARTGEIKSVADLAGRTVGIVAPGAPTEVWTRTLMQQASAAGGARVRFVALGANIYDQLRLGLIDAAWVNEPSLTMLRAQGATVLVNFMESDDAHRVFGGDYALMGVSVRASEAAARRDEMAAIGRAMNRALIALQEQPPEDAIRALPSPMLAGLDVKLLADVLTRYRASLYPRSAAIDVAACARVADTLRALDLIPAGFDFNRALDLTIVPA
jgi:NitT/TauT family transport system substrate-binding protein